MKTSWFILPILGLALVGCDKNVNEPKASSNMTQDKDNTGRNVRDRDFQTVTPGDQSETEADRVITQNIRRAIMQDNALSTNAKNIKIITAQQVVTLRGVVNTDMERNAILQKAKQFADGNRITDQIEVTNR